SRGTLVAVTAIKTGTVRKLRPVLTGEKCSTVCAYNDVKKNALNMPATIGIMVMLAPTMLRILKILNGTNGYLVRSSFQMKNASSAALEPRYTSVLTAVQP